MFPLASLSILLLITSFQTSESITGPHIADVNLLLPPRMTHPVEYRLLGSDGCFKWSWDHHDILSVKPEYNGSNSRCSTSARLISIARYAGRKETAVYAADLGTGVVIRVKVFIDNVSRVQIFHNSVKLDLDGLSTLRVRAFDAEENVFSSLVGLQFMWQLTPENGGTHRLVHVPLSESPLNDCGGSCGDLDIQIKLENSGVFSDLIVVKGAEIGHEIVSVNLVEPSFEHLADEIVLTVAEAMSIYPRSPVFVIVGALVRYNLNVIRQNSPKVINLPSPHHRWSALNSSVAQVDSQLGVTNALMLGITTITLEDTRVAGHVQMSSLHVVLPETLTLYKLPITALDEPIEGIQTESSVDRWYIIAGQQYVIHLKIFSCGPGAREIYITESDDVKLQYESTYWETVTVEDDIADKLGWQSSRILKAVSHGLGRLTASLAYHSALPDSVEVLKVVQEVTVCSQVRLATGQLMDPSENIHLPWAPGVYQELELRATGGCGETYTDYKWYSSDMATVSISASGVLQAKKPGQVTVKVVSVFDPKNYDEVIVKVSIPSSLVMLQGYAVETVVGTHLQAAVTLKSSDGSYFSRCNSFNSFVKWKSGSESFIIANTTGDALSFKNVQDVNGSKSINNPPCTWTYVYASSVGRALLHATLFKELPSSVHRSEGPRYLKASSRIAAYHPLAVEQVGNGNQFGGYGIGMPIENLNELFLAPRTELDLRLTGGPELWGADVEFIENIVIFDEEHRTSTDEVRVDQATTSSGEEYFRILCLTLGSFHLVFSRGNLVGEDHPLPAIEKVDLSLTCIFPSSIALITNEPVNTPDIIRSAVQADRSPGRVHTTPITVANGCTIRVAVVGIHNSGKAFANSSSLSLKWELMNCKGLADWNANDLERSGTSWERFLNLENASGLNNEETDQTNTRRALKSVEESITELTASNKLMAKQIKAMLVAVMASPARVASSEVVGNEVDSSEGGSSKGRGRGFLLDSFMRDGRLACINPMNPPLLRVVGRGKEAIFFRDHVERNGYDDSQGCRRMLPNSNNDLAQGDGLEALPEERQRGPKRIRRLSTKGERLLSSPGIVRAANRVAKMETNGRDAGMPASRHGP
ncbi:hypothetical protein GIB67_030835 [Kingdonia uniflora]|uniref:Uncharacterized protein n=1 Tax=Kingdonia uniflora TaxID=39325 RepID=A0A7J7L366_9MAGN|nr:hypothetical protein GIB67_030835 [Kingdonia uniflora]